MSFPRYPKYKPSGVSWFGDAPEHWPTIRYKNVFKEKQSVSGDSLPSGSISFGRVVFKSDKILHELTKASYQEVLAGEFLINPINLNYDLKSLRTGLSDIDTCVSPAYIVLRAKAESDKNYLKYQLHLFDVSHMKTLGAGVRQTITFGDIGTCSTCLPPLAEQTAIAEFLDRETLKIDGLVAEQRRLMELLKEKRLAVISHAVTKGLNPRAPMKPSGIEWLGDVPAGWAVDRIKRSVLSSKNGVWGAEPQQDESDIPCVRVADFDRQKLRVQLSEPTIRNVVESERVGRILCKGDLLLEKAGGGELQPVGCVILYDDDRPAVCSNFVARVQVAPGMNASFWRYVHAAAYAVRLNTRSIKQTSGIQNLDGSQYFDERAAFPPLPEQTAIAEFLDTELAKFDDLTAEAQRAIDLLQERRTALISAAVTGQIDVRQHPKN